MKKIIVLIVLVGISFSCQKNKFLKVDFVKIYMQNNTYENNVLVFDAFPTEDNGYVLFAVQGNVKTVFERVNSVGVMKVSRKGDLVWAKKFDDFDYGFPSNVVETDNGFDMFWSEESSIEEVNFRYNDTDTLSVTKRVVNCSFNEYNCNKAYKICPNLQSGPYYYMNFGVDDQTFFTFVANSDNNSANLLGQYKTNVTEIFPNLDQYNPATKYDRSFWIRTWNGRYYLNAPYKNEFALLELGNHIPIYSDENYWMADHFFNDGDKVAAVITPRNLRSEEGSVYFIPAIDLNKINQDFKDLQNIVSLSGIDSDYKTIIHPYGDFYLIAATSISGSTVLYVIREDGQIVRVHSFGEMNNYQVSALKLSYDKKSFAIFGTTKVNGKYQRAYYIKIPVDEIL